MKENKFPPLKWWFNEFIKDLKVKQHVELSKYKRLFKERHNSIKRMEKYGLDQWDIKRLDKNRWFIKTISLLNQIPGVKILSSCVGHNSKQKRDYTPHITFMDVRNQKFLKRYKNELVPHLLNRCEEPWVLSSIRYEIIEYLKFKKPANWKEIYNITNKCVGEYK